MVVIKEYRVTLPMTVEEYQIAQLYSVAEASKNETGGGEGVEVIMNEPYDNVPPLNGQYTKGQYTYKIYRLESKAPGWLKLLAPAGSLEIHEEAWNAYPYCKTVVSNPGYMKKNFYVTVETLHLGDRGDKENVHELDQERLKKRAVVHIDIANDSVRTADYKKESDPKIFRSEKTGRGPLEEQWKETVDPVMTAYKLVTIQFKWLGLQDRAEKFGHVAERRMFTNFHRELFCWMDRWHGMTMADIRELEGATKAELDKGRNKGAIKGTVAIEK